MLTARASAATAPRGLLDLYCGVGAPGLLLAADYATVLGLEQDARAVRLATTNAANNAQNHCRYEAGDAALRLERIADCERGSVWSAIFPASQTAPHSPPAEERMAEKDAPAGQIFPSITDALVDPPRAGLSPRALESLLRIAPELILYISCNPATLARDAGQMCKHYKLEALSAVDLFPHTPHLECVSLWQKK